ncbi:hypothetical protein I4U23_005018 [Adineta vaga]|nr:hypothetical protein I4U23_005018 [Adineta vaga]
MTSTNPNQTLITVLNLRKKNIKDNDVIILSEALQNDKTLTELYLSSNYITSTVKILELKNNHIDDDEIKHIVGILQDNSTVVALNLRQKDIHDDGVQSLAHLLQNNYVLNTMNLSKNQFADKGLISLADAMKINVAIFTLDLWDNLFSDDLVMKLTKQDRRMISSSELDYKHLENEIIN